jgi:hypothetical protein
MNCKLILFSSLVTALIGAILGLGIAEMSENPHISRHYQDLHLKFALVGAVVGAAVGAGQESVRELKVSQTQASDSSSFLSRHEL